MANFCVHTGDPNSGHHEFMLPGTLQTVLSQPCLHNFKNHFLCMDVLLAWMCMYHRCAWLLRSPGDGVGSLEVELQKVVGCCLHARNLTQDLWKSSKCF